eukprot:gene23031-30225_t
MIKETGLDVGSIFVEIGAGLCRPAMHVLLDPGVLKAINFEFDHPKVTKKPSSWNALRSFASEQSKPKAESGKYDSLELTDEKVRALTDKIPQRPVGVVEGTSYSLIILAAFGVLAFVIYQFIVGFIIEPTQMTCFNLTLDRLKTDPRITVRLGSSDDIRAWGSNSSSRMARQQVPHQVYKDAQGVEHVR